MSIHRDRAPVLVIGAAGGVGRAVCRGLTERGLITRGLVRPEDDLRGLALSAEDIVTGSVDDPGAVGRALEGAGAVINCAGLLPRDLHLDAELFRRVNVVGALNVLDQAHERNVRSAIFFSTISVLDHQKTNPGVDQLFDYLPGPHDPYLASKIALERGLRAKVGSIRTAISLMRLAFVYGPDNYAVWDEPIALLRAGKMRMIGGGQGLLPLVYAEDIGEFVAERIVAPTEPGSLTIDVLASAESTTMSDVFGALAREFEVPSPKSIPVAPLRMAANVIQVVPPRLRPGRLRLLTPARVYQYSHGYNVSGLIHSTVGHATPTGHRDGLAQMAQDYLARMT